MAAKTVEVEELMNTVLVCDVCMEPFDSGTRVPLLLPCRHSFCLSCLESLSKGGDFRCPTCRHLVPVSGPVATSLPKDIISLKVVDYLTMKSAVQKVPCTDCVDKNTAGYRCLTCHLNLCQACQDGHRRVPFFRSHTVRSLEELAAAPGDFLAEAETCGEHVGVALNLYCDSQACKVALCTSCAMVAHLQDSHSIMDLSKAHERAKKEHTDLLALLEKEEERKTGILNDVKKKTELVETSAATASDQVNQAMDRLLEAVEERRTQLLDEVRQTKDRQTAELKKMEEETSSHVSQIQEATGYLRRAECLSRQAEFISVVHAQGPSIRKLASTDYYATLSKSFSGDYPAGPFAGVTVGQGFSFADLAKTGADTSGFTQKADTPFQWASAGQKLFGGDKAPQKQKEVRPSEDVDFKPAIPLPPLVERKSGEEGWTPIYSQHCRLYRYDNASNQWKERGIGEMKILKDEKEYRYRLLMRREQVLKVACNQMLTSDLALKPLATSETAWCWVATDFSEGKVTVEKFALKFKNTELAKAFYDVVSECQATLAVIGEKGWTRIYCQNCTLFRIDHDTNKWKEHATGEMKIYKENNQSRYRLLMQDERTLKLICNQRLTSSLTLRSLGNLDTACVWVATDFSDGQPRTEKFSIKFKNTASANEFHDLLMECKAKLPAVVQ